MSENLNDVVNEVVEDATVMTVPIDDTLSISGEAADAKAVGDALALKADASQVTGISVNGQSADLQGKIIVNATQIEMSDTDDTKVQAAIAAAAGRTGADIPVNGQAGAVTIEQAIAGASGSNASVTANALNLPGEITDDSYAVQAVKMGSAAALPVLDPSAVKSVNNVLPASNGNVNITTVDVARQLQTNKAQLSEGTFLRRTAGGTANIGDGDAWLGVVRGNMVHTGYTAESFAVTVTSEAAEPITADVTDTATFRTQAEEGGTYEFNYTDSWDVNPASWGVTVDGTPESGDKITVVWTEEVRGTITPATPTGFTASGWNLYNHTAGYARVLKYSGSDSTMFMISGTYTGLQFSATPDGTRTTITPDANGGFDVASDGYIFVTGGNNTDTAIWMPWSDWDTGYEGGFQTYSESTVDLNDALTTCFPNGLCAVGTVQDEINITIGQAIQRIERMAYSAENLAAVIAAGRAYEYDENYIYAALDEADWIVTDFAEEEITVDGAFTANDHGLEWFEGTGVACWAQLMYGENLVDKLRTDVLTISPQELEDSQQASVRANIAAAPDSSVAIIIDGNKASVNVAKGDYVLLRNSAISGKDDGLYTAAAAVNANTAFTAANLTAVSGGGLNALNSKIGNMPDFVSITLTANTAKAIDVEDGSRIFIIFEGANDNCCGTLVLFSTAGGAVRTSKTGAANITYTTATNKITFTSAANCEMICQVYAGGISA